MALTQKAQNITNIESQRNKKWALVFVLLVAFNVLTIFLPFYVLHWLHQQAENHVSGTEFFVLLLAPFFYCGAIVAAASAAAAVKYLVKVKAKIYWVITSCALLLVAAPYLSWFIYSQFQGAKAWSHVKDLKAQQQQRIAESQQARAIPYGNISIDQAKQLLDACVVDGFYYTLHSIPGTNITNEQLPTGVYYYQRSDTDSRQIYLSVSDSAASQLVPVAQKDKAGSCIYLSIWHDGKFD